MNRYDSHPRTLALLVAMLLLLTLAGPAIGGGYVVIANKSVTANTLSKPELQAIFLGEKVKWDHSQYIKIALPEDKESVRDFLEHVVGKTNSQFENHWMKLAYTGRAMLPPSFPDTNALIDYVGRQRGAIGVVPSGQALGSVKTITVK